MSNLVETVIEALVDIQASFVEKYADGKLSFSEMFKLSTEVVERLVAVAEAFGGTGMDKRQAVIDAAVKLWDESLRDMDIPYLPDVIVDPMIEAMIPTVVGKIIDLAVARFNITEWPGGA